MTVYAAPGAAGAKIAYKPRYDNFIGGKFQPPVEGQYFDVISPINGKVYTQAARSSARDVELALDLTRGKPGAEQLALSDGEAPAALAELFRAPRGQLLHEARGA